MNLFYSYSIIFSLFEQVSLTIEHAKLEVFSRSIKNFNPLFLNLGLIKDSLLWLKKSWRYFRFIFNRKLFLCQHIHYYSDKALSTVKGMKMLGNSTRSLLPLHKQLLYYTCIMPIILHKFPLWYFKKYLSLSSF